MAIKISEYTQELTTFDTPETIKQEVSMETSPSVYETKWYSWTTLKNFFTLKNVLTIGNETDGTNIKVNDADAIELENASTLKKGTYDFGASGGISRICGVGYEDMWQAGIHHVFDSNGFIRESNNCFNIIPDGSFDNTLQFKVGSRWILDDGTVYICTAIPSVGNAVWDLQASTPTLQEVTDAGAETTKRISIGNVPSDIYVQYREDGVIKHEASNITKLNFITPTGTGQINIPDVVNATETFALLSDLPAGGGDVTGPASATTNNIAVFSDTTGKIIKDGGATIAGINTNAVDLVTVKLSEAISKGQAVYVSGANGTNILVSKASNTSEATSSKTLGLLATSGATNAIVNVVTSGLIDNIDTSAATAAGDPVWLGTSGNLIFGLASKPYAPAHLVYIGVVSRKSATVGEIIVKVQNGFELKEIHDVDLITNAPTNNQALVYESSSSLWKNKSLTTASVAASTDKNYVTDAQAVVIGNTSGTNSGNETTTTTGALINGATAKTTPVDADFIGLMDSAASNILKKLSWLNVKATLKTYFDTLYQAVGTYLVASNNLSDLTNTSTARTNLGLDNRSAVLAETATDGTVSSGTSSTYSSGVLITPAMIDADTTIEVLCRVRFTGVASTKTVRIYANATNDLSGSPILLGINSAIPSTNLTYLFARLLAIKVKAGTGAGTEVYPTSVTTFNNEFNSSIVAVTSAAIDWTTNKYIIVAIQAANVSDAGRCSFLKVRR
jgi:hypothetical protein